MGYGWGGPGAICTAGDARLHRPSTQSSGNVLVQHWRKNGPVTGQDGGAKGREGFDFGCLFPCTERTGRKCEKGRRMEDGKGMYYGPFGMGGPNEWAL